MFSALNPSFPFGRFGILFVIKVNLMENEMISYVNLMDFALAAKFSLSSNLMI